MIGVQVSLWSRVSKATFAGVLSAVGWILFPYFISTRLSASGLLAAAGTAVSGTLFSTGYLLAFGTILTALFVLAAATDGMAVSMPFGFGANLASAYFIYAVTSGGVMDLSFQGQQIVLSFQPILILLMLPSLIGAARAPINFLLERSEAARASSDTV